LRSANDRDRQARNRCADASKSNKAAAIECAHAGDYAELTAAGQASIV